MAEIEILDSVEAGAQENKIKITPAMTKAGAELIWSYFYDVMVLGIASTSYPGHAQFGMAAAIPVYHHDRLICRVVEIDYSRRER